MTKLSVVIITYNEEKNIGKCLDSVKDIADEIIIVDSFSTDKTEDICKRYNKLTFVKNEFINYGTQKQFAIEYASNDFILSLDADEYLTDALSREIKEIKDKKNIQSGYYLHRDTFYINKILYFYGLRSKRHLRLFNRKSGRFTDSEVHEEFITNEKCRKLKNRLIHYPYKDLTHHIGKINKYTSLYAKTNAGKKKCSVLKIISKSTIRFFIIYILHFSFMDGYAGFSWAKAGAFYSYLKYAKLREINKKHKK